MRTKTFAAALMVISLAPMPVSISRPVTVPHGAYTGLTYKALPDQGRGYYLAGLWDGVMASSLFGANEKLTESFHQCLLRFTQPQAMAIVDKYIADHPAEWQFDMQVLGVTALREVCAAYDADDRKYGGH